MTAEALVQRALTAIAYKLSGKRIAYSDLRSGRDLTDSDYQLLRDAYDQFHELPVTIDPQPNLTIAQITMRARRYQQKHGLDEPPRRGRPGLEARRPRSGTPHFIRGCMSAYHPIFVARSADVM